MKTLTVKNMLETLVNYSDCRNEMFNTIFESFLTMKQCGFVTDETWCKFFQKCSFWYVDEEMMKIVDGNTGAIIYDFNSGEPYKA